MDTMDKIFEAYVVKYQHILSCFYPAKGSTGFVERNLTVNWSKAAEVVCGSENVISWFEFQFGKNNKKHIDALVWDRSAGNLFLLESKRFSNLPSKICEIGDDIVRLQDLFEEIKEEKGARIELDKVHHCYGVILADVWPKKGIQCPKRTILESYENCTFLADNICNFSESAQQRLKNYPFADLKYYHTVFDNVSSKEQYALVSLSWRIA